MTVARDAVLLLRRFPYGESSLVVHGLARQHGRVHLLAKGAYRPTSSTYALLDLFDTLELEWNRKQGRELDLVHKGHMRTRRATIPADLERYRAALAALELVDVVAQPGQADTRLFDDLETCLDDLATGGETGRQPDVTLVVFELAFLQNLGLAPALLSCAACGGPAPPLDAGPRAESRVAFSAGAGGRLCRSCAVDARSSGRRVGTLPLSVVERTATLASDPNLTEHVPRDEAIRIRDLTERFLAHHLETVPRSRRAFLAASNRNAPRPTRP